jgi:AraC-like DNA-binding protein
MEDTRTQINKEHQMLKLEKDKHLVYIVCMTNYTHLSIADRKRISKLREQNYSIRQTAKCLGRSPSTISRELKRGCTSTSIGQ